MKRNQGRLVAMFVSPSFFKNRYSLKRNSYAHSDEIFGCEKCDRRNITARISCVDILTAHPDVAFECDRYQATFRDEEGLKEQPLLLVGQCAPQVPRGTVFECFVCERTFRSDAGLIRQSQVHKRLSSVCAYCEEYFRREDLLDMHTEHGVDLPPVDTSGLGCEICGKVFKKMFKLKEHLLTHSDERSFLCNQCGQGFKTKTSLRLHELRHAPEKPFQCEECPKSYYQSKELKQHVSSAHRGKIKGRFLK